MANMTPEEARDFLRSLGFGRLLDGIDARLAEEARVHGSLPEHPTSASDIDQPNQKDLLSHVEFHESIEASARQLAIQVAGQNLPMARQIVAFLLDDEKAVQNTDGSDETLGTEGKSDPDDQPRYSQNELDEALAHQKATFGTQAEAIETAADVLESSKVTYNGALDDVLQLATDRDLDDDAQVRVGDVKDLIEGLRKPVEPQFEGEGISLA